MRKFLSLAALTLTALCLTGEARACNLVGGCGVVAVNNGFVPVGNTVIVERGLFRRRVTVINNVGGVAAGVNGVGVNVRVGGIGGINRIGGFRRVR